MSKKHPKSDRSVDLPDWADDVTPTDEVMKKFYAPTGAFKRGPIAPPDPVPAVSHALTSNQTPSGESLQSDTDQQDNHQSEAAMAASSSASAKAQQPESSAIPTDSAPPPSEQSQSDAAPTILSTPPRELGRDQVSSVKTPDNDESARRSIHQTLSQAPAINKFPAFEAFASKWKLYLYPGQLAVLRTLYEVTYAVGTDECFTRYSEIAKSTKMTRRNCINVMNSLVYRGFVERLEVRNDATCKGIRLRIYLDPLH